MIDEDSAEILLALKWIEKRIRRIEESLTPPKMSEQAQRVHDAIFGGKSIYR